MRVPALSDIGIIDFEFIGEGEEEEIGNSGTKAPFLKMTDLGDRRRSIVRVCGRGMKLTPIAM